MVISFFAFFKKYGTICGSVFLFFISQQDHVFSQSTAEILTQKAFSLNLQNHRYWQILLHYQATVFGGVKSEIDDPKFFFAKNGQKDSAAELRATIATFFGPQKSKDTICKFYARYRWIKEQLDPDNIFSEDIRCEEIEAIKPGPVSVIFPTYYMNNPASMFGHTLLTISSDKNIRLAHSVNYAAQTDTTNGIHFAVGGIFGFFKGYYSVTPYYKKIQEYSDINQRDMWEYRLNLSEEETKRMIWHISELNEIYLNYYFFQKNCSYNLLYLLEAARPTLNLVNRFKMAVMPIETVRAMQKELLAPSEQKIVLRLIAEDPRQVLETASKDETTQAKILDLATELLQLFLVEKSISGNEYKSRLITLLRLRSALGKKASPPLITPPASPDTGHDSNKITLSSGFTFKDNEFFHELRFRPAFTDLTDPDYIQGKGAKIEFLDTKLQYVPKTDTLRLQHLDVLDILSVSPRDEIFKPISWKIKTGLNRKITPAGKDALVFQLGTGGGGAYSLFSEKCLAYAMLEQQSEVGNRLKKGFDIGFGATAGLIVSPVDGLKTHLFSRHLRFYPSNSAFFEAAISTNLRLSRNMHLTLDCAYEKGEAHEKTQSVLSLGLFF